MGYLWRVSHKGPDVPPALRLYSILRHLPQVTRYTVADRRWTLPPLRVAVLSDLHVGAPWVSLDYVARVVAQMNGLGADLILLAGDYLMERKLRLISRRASPTEIAAVLSALRAPLGVHGILGNHDWKNCDKAAESDHTENAVLDAFAAEGRPLLRNASRHIAHGTSGFWLVGTDSQRAIKLGPGRYTSFLDADAAFADVPPGALAIHLAHEPDYFATADPRAFLQVSGHTHGGQVKLCGRTPKVPSVYGSRYAYGQVDENGNHLVVSAGIGYSGLPLRLGVPPEIVLITIQG